MADPLSTAAAIVSIVVPALHGTRLLLNDLESLKDAPKTVKRLTGDVQAVDAALELLRGVDERDWELLGSKVAEQSRTTINSCARACDLFRSDLQRWTRHSEDGKLTWKDRANVGFFKQGQIKAMSDQLQSCKLTISSIVSIANLYSSVRQNHVTEEIKTAIATNQAEVQKAITTAESQVAVLESRVEEMNLSGDDNEDEISAERDRIEALNQLDEERKALKASRELLDELLSKAQEDAVIKAAAGIQSGSTTVTFGSNNSGFQAGTISGGVHGLTFGRR